VIATAFTASISVLFAALREMRADRISANEDCVFTSHKVAIRNPAMSLEAADASGSIPQHHPSLDVLRDLAADGPDDRLHHVNAVSLDRRAAGDPGRFVQVSCRVGA